MHHLNNKTKIRFCFITTPLVCCESTFLIDFWGMNMAILTNGNDYKQFGNSNNLVFARKGNDTIFGNGGDDTIFGGSGDDQLHGGNDNDIIRGGSGNDIINGDAGNDRLFGGAEDDTINGGSGNDSIDGDSGDDEIYGGDGEDTLSGGVGKDELYGGKDNDSIDGGLGDDYIDGGDDRDTIKGGSGDDSIYGGSGGDTIYGGMGDDSIEGGSGNDVIHADGGTDTVNGGEGKDTYYLDETFNSTDTVYITNATPDNHNGDSLADSYDVVHDFEIGKFKGYSDKIDFSHFIGRASAGTMDGLHNVGDIKSHQIDYKGLMTFDNNDTYDGIPLSSTSTSLNLDDVVNYLQANIADTHAFAFVIQNNTYVYQSGGVGVPDTMVELVGVQADGINAGANSVWVV